MIAIEDTLISDDIVEQYFCCDLEKCKGICCIEGDAGAPMEIEEIDFLEDHIEEIFPYMTEEGKQVIKEKGVFDLDSFGEYVTPLINNAACAYYYKEGEILSCAIEKAYQDGKISFRKPCSCFLYPIRVQKYEHYKAVNYHKWTICKDACTKGKNEGILLYEFLRKPLTEYFGEEWYEALEAYANHAKNNCSTD